MTFEQGAILVILVLLFTFFLWGRWRYDVSAFLALLSAVILGVVAPHEAFRGFSHAATITVAAVLILNRALVNTGVSDHLAKALMPFTRTPSLHILSLGSLAVLLSGFMNNIAALALLMPVTISTAHKAQRSPSLILMPLSFCSLLGGLTTLIGTPPNIIIASFRETALGTPFKMFDFTPVGVTVAVAGLFFLSFVGWRFLPKDRRQQKTVEDLLDLENYLAEAKVVSTSKAIGMTVSEIEHLAKDSNVFIAAVLKNGNEAIPVSRHQPLKVGDILIIEAEPKEIDGFVNRFSFQIVGLEDNKASFFKGSKATLVEVVVGPHSPVEKRRVEEVRFRRRHGLTLLGVSHQGQSHRGRLKNFRFEVGDVLLVHGHEDQINDAIANLNLLPLASRDLQFGKRGMLLKAVALFAMGIVMAATGLLPLPIALSLSAVSTVLLGIVKPDEAYKSIDWPIIVLLGAMIPLACAFKETGAADILAGQLLTFARGASPAVVLTLMMILTMLLTDVLNNAATALIMAPISISLATQLGVNPDPFLMGVAVASSCAFLTPIGHQNNALILGPGGYKFSDYWRMGLPLEGLIIALSVPLLLTVWPL